MNEIRAGEQPPAAEPRRPQLLYVAVGAIILAAIVLLLWQPWQSRDPLAAFADIRFIDSVAVLPVENRTGDPAMGNLCSGITEEMVGRLKQAGSIKVSDPYSVQSLLAQGLTTRDLADSLAVEKLVFGSLYATQDGVRLNVRVADGTSGDVLSTQRYDWGAGDGFETALTLAQFFVDDYVASIPLVTVPSPRPTAQSSGHESYLVGRNWLGRRTAVGLERARAAFNRAIALDPGYAEAYSGLSNVYALSLAYRYEIGMDGYRVAGHALAMANRSIQLDPNSSSGYSARGYLASRSFAPVSQVASDCRRAIDLEPSAADVLSWCARVLNQRGDVEAAFRAAEQAIALDPQNAGRRLALAYDALALGRYQRAIREAALAHELEPGLMLPRAIEARARLLAGEAEECAAMELGPHAGIRAMCLHRLGRREEADGVVDSLVALLESGSLRDPVYTEVVRVEDLATYYAWIGDADAALRWVERAYELSPSGVEPRVLESALFQRVGEDSRFEREVARIRSGIWDRVIGESRAIAEEQQG
jgi:TolB-like protein/tetratricopeptide (TPR) repeat protein